MPRNWSLPAPFNPLASFLYLKNRRMPLPSTSVLVSTDEPLAKLPLHRSELSCPAHSSMAEGTPAHRPRALLGLCPTPRLARRPPASAARGVQPARPARLACTAASRRSSPARMPHRAHVQQPHAGSSSARPARFVVRRRRKVRSHPPTPFFLVVCRVPAPLCTIPFVARRRSLARPNQSRPRHCVVVPDRPRSSRALCTLLLSALVSVGCRRRGENAVCPGLPLDVYPHHLPLHVAPSSPCSCVCTCHHAVRAPSARCSCVLVAHAYRARSRRSFAGSCTRRASGSHLVCMLFHTCKFTCCPHTSLFA
jgi:hypothetical protein